MKHFVKSYPNAKDLYVFFAFVILFSWLAYLHFYLKMHLKHRYFKECFS